MVGGKRKAGKDELSQEVQIQKKSKPKVKKTSKKKQGFVPNMLFPVVFPSKKLTFGCLKGIRKRQKKWIYEKDP